MRGQCLPWSDQDHSIAEETYRALLEAAVRHMAALSEVGAKDSAVPDDVAMKRLDTIRWLAVRLDELLNSLLEYSSLGRADLRMTPVSLDGVLDEVEEIFGARFAEADMQLRRPMRLGVVSGDRIRLQEVLVNLIGNAVSYAAADPPRWVEVGYEDAIPPDVGQPVRAFYVRDNGIGVRAERPEDRSGSAARGGTAALTISRRIVERHGGRLWVRSVPQQGNTFYFTV